MKRSEIAALLGLAAARDRRIVGEVDVLAWHTDVGDIDFLDAKKALERHFRESTEYLMPVHIRAHAKVIRAERNCGTSAPLALPGKLEDDTARDVRMARGMAECREVLDAIVRRLEASRRPAVGEPSRSDQLRDRALRRAREERSHAARTRRAEVRSA